MSIERRVFFSRAALRLMSAAGIAASVAGCSDATRFSNPFANPFQGSPQDVDRAPTGAISERSAQSRAVQSSPLPAAGAPSASAAPARPMASEPSVQSAGKSGSYAHWSAEGGTPVVAAQGETAGAIATRYGVPTDVLLRVNGFTSAAQVRPGSRLVIPVYRASAEPVRAAAAEKSAPRSARASVSAASTNPSKSARAKGGDDLGFKSAKAAQTRSEQARLASEPKAAKPERRATASAGGQDGAASVDKSPKVDGAPTSSIAPRNEEKPSEAAHPEFRWPARGRIIQGFNAGGNDGINISVPEGTQVKAAEGGVVAYAGNELKGYGNLVLIRHPNGFVTAYANNAELEVKRGDQVKRGQTIAKSGQSGNVGSPQLHFELRKGSTPVDPTGYLAGL